MHSINALVINELYSLLGGTKLAQLVATCHIRRRWVKWSRFWKRRLDCTILISCYTHEATDHVRTRKSRTMLSPGLFSACFELFRELVRMLYQHLSLISKTFQFSTHWLGGHAHLIITNYVVFGFKINLGNKDKLILCDYIIIRGSHVFFISKEN